MNIKNISIGLIKKGVIIYILLALFALFHFYLVTKTFIFDDADNIHTAYSGYGDIPFHMTQVSKFGFGSLFDFDEPLFHGEKIRYSFIINYLSGILLKFTNSWTFSMHAPSILFLAGSYVFIFYIFNKILLKRWAALIGIIIFFLGSGVGGYGLIKTKLIEDKMPIPAFINYLTDNNIFTFTNLKAVYPQQNTDWGSPMSLSFLHQRSFFLGLFLFSIFFYFLVFKAKEFDRKPYLLLAGTAFGLGPLGHYHTFIVMAIVGSFYFIKSLLLKDFDYARKLLIIGIIAGIIALPQIIYLLSGNNPEIFAGDSSLIKFRLGWMSEINGLGSVQYPPGEAINWGVKFLIYLKFLWINFGFILVFFGLGLCIKSIRSSSSHLFWLAGIIFLVNQFFQFQPWDYDNNKLLVYFAFFTAPIVVMVMQVFINKYKFFGILISAAMLISVIFSGIIDVIPRYKVEVNKMPVIFDSDAVATAHHIRNNIKEREVILATTTHLNIASSLSGRPTVVGFPGWLWTKGIIYTSREQELKKFYSDPVSNRGIASRYGSKYILLDPTAIYGWKVNKQIFDANFIKIFESKKYTLYEISTN